MAKVFMYAGVLTGILFLMAVAGVSTSSNQLYQSFTGGDIKWSDLVLNVTTILSLGTALAGIAISYFTKQSTESMLIAGFAGAAFGWIIGDLRSITLIVTEPEYISLAIKAIIYPLIAGFCFAIISWWRGADS